MAGFQLHWKTLNRWWVWVLAAIGFLVLLVAVLSYVIQSDALRRYAEKQMNRHLKGYTVRIGGANFHPIGFSLDLNNLILIQNANPDPPVASIHRLHASVHWHELLRATVVGDFLLDGPKFYINIKNIRKEEESKIPLKKKGWQEALQSIYPLKINAFRVRDGEVTYVDEGPYKPLHASHINGTATNIRNVRSADRVYPSPVHLEGRIFEKGELILDGMANFLEEPTIGFKTDFKLSNMDLGYFKPITSRENISLNKGMLSAKGSLEYAPEITAVNLHTVEIKGAEADYVHLSKTAAAEKKRAQEAAQKAKELSNKPTAKIRIESLKIEGSTLGMVNKTTDPNFRLYFDGLNATLKNFSNQFAEGPATLNLTGKFMGSGDTKVDGTFRSETKSPDFYLSIAIKNTNMTTMNNLFRAYGNFDIKAGLFSFFSELTVKNNQVEGYVKPLFQDMQVTDRRDKEQKSIFHKLYVGLVGGVSKLLENRPREEVATKADVSGPLQNPRTSTWQVIVNLLQNAFVRAILPGFEKQVVGEAKK